MKRLGLLYPFPNTRPLVRRLSRAAERMEGRRDIPEAQRDLWSEGLHTRAEQLREVSEGTYLALERLARLPYNSCTVREVRRQNAES